MEYPKKSMFWKNKVPIKAFGSDHGPRLVKAPIRIYNEFYCADCAYQTQLLLFCYL
jgi:hypothetical protein